VRDEISRNGAVSEPSVELDQLARDAIGAAIEVHRELGPDYHESVYEETMAIELELRGIPFKRQLARPVMYKGRPVGEGRMDMLVADDLVVEYKTVDSLLPAPPCAGALVSEGCSPSPGPADQFQRFRAQGGDKEGGSFLNCCLLGVLAVYSCWSIIE